MNLKSFNRQRVRVLAKTEHIIHQHKPVLYWMSRDQRVQDNWALIYAQSLATAKLAPLHVCFCLVPKFLDATIRHYDFMLNGLKEVEKELSGLNIGFHLLIGRAIDCLPKFIETHDVGAVVCDFSPLRVPLSWVNEVKKVLPENVYYAQVDAHNIVPCWVTSNKQEYAARTIRRKIHEKLPEFCIEFPQVEKHKYNSNLPSPADWGKAFASLEVDMTVKPVEWAKPGTKEGLEMLDSFIKQRLPGYGSDRNNPTKNALSNLSPWFHFGQISTQRAALAVQGCKKYPESVKVFIEESVIRRELADNFCFYNEKYDSLEGAAQWAQKTLKEHETDKRDYIYDWGEFEEGKTHDPLWNAAQLQMVQTGKMHGFMRMYWAKKILEWTKSPKEALEFAVKLNDKYSLDGRDPNGYVGCMWSICGVHDQGWNERQVFGKIRFMNYNGCKKKFDVHKFMKGHARWMQM